MTQQPLFWVSTPQNLKTYICEDIRTPVFIVVFIIHGDQDMDATEVSFH